MVFGQAELTTRVYEYNISLQQYEPIDFTLSDITNGELDNSQNAILYLFDADDIVSSNGTYLRIVYEIGYYKTLGLFWNITDSDDNPITYYESNVYRSYFGGSNHQWRADSGNLSANLKIAVTAEFPEEDTGYIEEGFDYCIDVGANLVASPCEQSVPILDTLPSEIADNLTGIMGQGDAATNMDGNWVGSLTGLGGGNGYWMISNVNACFNYDCVEN